MEMGRKEGRSNVSLDVIGEDNLRNVLSRLPSSSFASAACVSRSWNRICDTVLYTPKLSSAFSTNPSLQEAVEEVFNKVFAELIRPHFAIVTVTSIDLHEARQLITNKLGSTIPIIYTAPNGVIGRDAITNEFKEIQWEVGERDQCPFVNFFDDDALVPQSRVICLTVGFLPGLKVATVPLLQTETGALEDEFMADIRDCVTSVSGCNSPVGIMLFSDCENTDDLLQKMDYSMSPETVIVGDRCGEFLCGVELINKKSNRKSQPLSVAAVALLFMREQKKPYGIGEINLHVALSAGLAPIGNTYEVTSVEENIVGDSWTNGLTRLSARREESRENLDGQIITTHIYHDLWDQIHYPAFIGVLKRGKCAVRLEKEKQITSLVFYDIWGNDQRCLFVGGDGIETGDCFRIFQPDTNMTLSSLRHVYDKFRDLKNPYDVGTSDCLTNRAAIGRENKIFGAFIFSSITRGEPIGDAISIVSTPFLETFPDVTLAGSCCSGEICRGDSSSYGQVSEQGFARCYVHHHSSVYLVMSYTPSLPSI
ncbi:F-box/LRR-repeat protein At5g63520-like [Apium graveolens]|uniref:F-box/LRR-repeat protein At5g63520-like n=1 Tax=Apium graveolens TaxID=4045 RepID=UPI003D793083